MSIIFLFLMLTILVKQSTGTGSSDTKTSSHHVPEKYRPMAFQIPEFKKLTHPSSTKPSVLESHLVKVGGSLLCWLEAFIHYPTLEINVRCQSDNHQTGDQMASQWWDFADDLKVYVKAAKEGYSNYETLHVSASRGSDFNAPFKGVSKFYAKIEHIMEQKNGLYDADNDMIVIEAVHG